jgi:hypothetical protein
MILTNTPSCKSSNPGYPDSDIDKVLSFDYAYVISGKVCAHIYKVSTSSIYPKRIPPSHEVREKKKEQREKEQEGKGLLSPRLAKTNNAKTDIVVRENAVAVVAVGRTAVLRIEVPRTTAQHFNVV